MIQAAAKEQSMLKFSAPIELTAADAETGKKPTFNILAYTGVPMNAGGFYMPVIVELSGVKTANADIPILLDHDPSQIVGQGQVEVDSGTIRVSGSVMGDSEEAKKVVALSKDGFKWQASIGASVVRREMLEAGKKATVNGREVSGPLMIARESMLQEVSFVAIGADQSTSAAVAASAQGKGAAMGFDGWLQAKGFDPSVLSDTQKTLLQGAYDEEIGSKKANTPSTVEDVLAKAEAKTARESRIANITAEFLANSPRGDADFISKIRTLAEVAVSAKWDADRYELELHRSSRPDHTLFKPRITDGRINNKIIEAALCMAGRLAGHEKMFDDQTLQAAHDQFKGRIGLNQFFSICAAANGYHDHSQSRSITLDAHRAAFGFNGPNSIKAAGFSTLTITNVLSNVANKFLMEGFNAVDSTALRLASIRPVSDLKTVTTVSLVGDLQYEKLGPGGEIKHGTLGERTYTNKAETYAKMLAITEDDIINDDLGALTAVPRKLGRGAATKLNDIFWTVWNRLETDGIFAAGNNNVNTAVADMTTGGLAATETIFMNQTDPNGLPLGIMPAIIVVPTALKPAATTLMTSERLITGATSVTQGDGNIFRDRFRVESSPYISNSSYTGFTSAAWVMMADPNELPLIEIAAYQGRVEPTVESANADFNTLGVQMRGYSRVGVAAQEYRAAVKADGGAS